MQNRGSIATRSSIAKEENSGKTNFEHRTDVDIYKKVDFGDEKVDAEIRELQEQLKLSLKNRRKRDKIYKSYIDLGNAYYKLFKFDKAEACHLKHLALARETKYYNEEQVKTALTNLGAALRQQRRYDQALLAYKEALEIAEKINDLRGNARILNNMANVYEMQYDFDNAIECHKARSEVSSKLKDIDGQIKAFAALGSLYNLKGELRESIMYYEKVIINLRMKIGNYELFPCFSKYSAYFDFH